MPVTIPLAFASHGINLVIVSALFPLELLAVNMVAPTVLRVLHARAMATALGPYSKLFN